MAGSGSGLPAAIKVAAAATSRIRPSRGSSMPVVLASRLTSRTPNPPLRSSETGAAPRISSSTSSSRSRSMTAPAAAASQSSGVVVEIIGSGAVSCIGPGRSPRSTCPTWRGKITVSASTRRSRPIASSCGTGRSGAAPGAASRVRPIGEPSSNFSSTSRWARVEPVDQIGDLFAAARGVLERDLPRMPRQRRGGVGGHPHRGLAPGQGALLEVVERGDHVRFGSAVADQRQQLGRRHRCRIGLQHQQRVEHGQPQEVEVVGGGLDRLTGLSARGQRGDAAGWRLGEVWPQLQQPDQPLVGQVGKP